MLADTVKRSNNDKGRDLIRSELQDNWHPSPIAAGGEFFKSDGPHSEPMIEDALERPVVMIVPSPDHDIEVFLERGRRVRGVGEEAGLLVIWRNDEDLQRVVRFFKRGARFAIVLRAFPQSLINPVGFIYPTLRSAHGDDGHGGDPRLELLQSHGVESEVRPFSGSTGENGWWNLGTQGISGAVFGRTRSSPAFYGVPRTGRL